MFFYDFVQNKCLLHLHFEVFIYLPNCMKLLKLFNVKSTIITFFILFNKL